MDDFDVILNRALALGQTRHPEVPQAHHAAFANSVTYAVTGASGGFGGPSMREHWASRLAHRAGRPGELSFDRAVEIVEQACYGPLTIDIARMLDEEHCFDDAPGERELARQLLAGGAN
jgi:hypothetical protein